MNPILMRLPGAGRSAQAEKIIDTYSILHISTRDMFRAAMKDETALGLEAKSYIDKGELTPDEVTNGIVKGHLAEPDTDRGFLSDGFPRTLDQAEALDTMLKELNKKISAVINIHIKKDVLIEHLTGRFIYRICGATCHKLFSLPEVEDACDCCGGHEFYQREDDRPETVRNRLAANIESSAPILAFYKEQGLMYTIDGNRKVGTAFSDVKKIVGEN